MQPNSPSLGPSPACRFTAAGERLVACDSPAGRLGLSVCYDLRFPELYQRLTYELGAQVLLVPSAFTVATGGRWRCACSCATANRQLCFRFSSVFKLCDAALAVQGGRTGKFCCGRGR